MRSLFSFIKRFFRSLRWRTTPPTPIITIHGSRVGICMANASIASPTGEFRGMLETGVQHTRLSAYYREPWSTERTIREAWDAHSTGLGVLVDVQPTPWLYPHPPTLQEWADAWEQLTKTLPPGAVVSVGNEVNADHWWPWGDQLLDQFWATAREIAHRNGRIFAGPHVAGDWGDSIRWLKSFLSRNPPPDILTVHYYGKDVIGWMSRLPWNDRVWLAEASLFESTPEQQAKHLSTLLSGDWERTYLYDWNADPGYLIKGTLVQNKLRKIIIPHN